MSLNPGGRISGGLHLFQQLPVSLQVCLAAAGFTVLAANAVPAEMQARFVPLWAIEAYCEDPAHPPLPLSAAVWKQFSSTCQCVDYTCPSS